MKISSPHPAPTFSTALPPLILLSTVFFVNFLSRTIFGPLLLPITTRLDLGLAQGTQIFLCLSSGYSVTVLCSGFLSQKIGHKKTIITSAVCIGLGLLGLATSTSFPLFLCWTALIGSGAGLYTPSSVVTITEITAPTHWGQAFSIHELAPNLAFILSPFLVEIFLGYLDDTTLFVLLGLACLGLGLLYSLRGPYIRRPGVPPKLGNIRTIVAGPAFWIVALCFVFCVGVEMGVYNLIPAYLVQGYGLERSQANFILGCARAMALLSLPLTGLIIKRLGYHASLVLCLVGTGAAIFLSGFGPLWWSAIMIALEFMFVVCFFPVGFAVLTLVCPKATSDLAVSLCIMCSSVLGLGILPGILAWTGEWIGLGPSFSVFGALMLIASLVVVKKLHIPASS